MNASALFPPILWLGLAALVMVGASSVEGTSFFRIILPIALAGVAVSSLRHHLRTPPPTFLEHSKVVLALGAMAFVLIPLTLYAIFIHAPVELQMGIVQKIFYFHVPSAYAMYLAFGTSGAGCFLYLWRKHPRWDALAVAGGEVGLVFCAMVLFTGPLWARKAWGTYWTWDPRLTTTLLVGLIFMAFNILRHFGEGGESEKRFAAALAALGLLLLPVIHYSVQRWRGQHPTVIGKGGGGIHPDMVPALVLGFALFSALAILFLVLRYRIETIRQRTREIEAELALKGLIEEGS